jgi:hypothetical protein
MIFDILPSKNYLLAPCFHTQNLNRAIMADTVINYYWPRMGENSYGKSN